MTRDELLEQLTVERFTPPTPSTRTDIETIPPLHVLAERRRALIEASEATTDRESA